MKKIFSFLMALCLVASVSAMPQIKHEAMKAAPNRAGMHSVQLPANHVAADRTLPMHKQLPADLGRHVCLHRGNQQSAAHPRKLANGQTYNITSVVGAEAVFLGSYYEVVYQDPFAYIWGFDMMGGNDEYVSLEFEGYSLERIAGTYHGVYGAISVTPGDTASVEGILTIEYKAAGEAGYSPLYTISGQFVDDNGNTYNLNVEYSFNEDEWSGEVYNLYAYAMCYLSGGTAAECDEIAIILEDAPITPSGEEMDVEIKNPASKSYYAMEDGWYISAKDDEWFASVEIYTEDLIGSFDSKDLSMAYTSLVAFEGDDTTYVDIYKPLSAVVSENAAKDTLFFDVDMLGIDGMTYHVNMFYP
ncbi:MAG: hypothetical protein MJZ75_06970, partial [Paludibacteraceae bacterium]|nr:hypothetical protein [Paludibacteraceae bacterium]